MLSAPDPETPTLYVDTRRCKHSHALCAELSLAHDDRGALRLDVVDLGVATPDELATTWLPGVPCFVHREEAACGVDAFSRSRDLARSPEGVCIAKFSWPT